MLTEDQIATIFLNYGIAGLILFVFYKLFSNELSQLRDSINQMNNNLTRLIDKIEQMLEKQK
jgi:predicted PurR-regulated permease PerM